MNYENRNYIGYLKDSIEGIEALYPNTTVGDLVRDALMHQIYLSETSASELGHRIQNLIIKTFKRPQKPVRLSAKNLQKAAHEINLLVKVNWKYDLDYIAGYAKHDPLKIYIDRDIKRYYVLPSGEVIDIARYLVVHEVIEKSLLNELKLDFRSYQRTHQIAQRLEQEVVRADGFSWREYQSAVMGPYIEKSVTKPIFNFPPDLDLIMYEDLKDPDLGRNIEIQKIPRSLTLKVGETRRIDNLFEVHEIMKDVFYLRFDDATSMAHTMMRFQEFQDSPKFRGMYFSREEYEKWYREEYGAFTYVKDWGGYGFNVDSNALQPFYEGHFAPLIEEEKHVLDFFSDRTAPFYIIATSPQSSHEMMGHEIAHALYYVNPAYKQEVMEILSKVDIHPVKNFLKTAPGYGGYHDEVLDDEVHAYLSQTTEELKENGFDTAPFADVIKKLQAVYQKYSQGIANLPRE